MPSRSVDTNRLAEAISRPGLDPRMWVYLAVVREMHYDAEHGIFADVTVIPEGDIETCQVGALYSGADFGMSGGLEAGDLVVVVVPQGDPGHGPIIISKLWTASDPPPPEMAVLDNATVVVKAGTTLNVVCREGATVNLVAEEGSITLNSPDVRLGGDAPAQSAILGDTLIDTLLSGATVATGTGPSGPLIPAAGVNTPWLGAKSVKVKLE